MTHTIYSPTIVHYNWIEMKEMAASYFILFYQLTFGKAVCSIWSPKVLIVSAEME